MAFLRPNSSHSRVRASGVARRQTKGTLLGKPVVAPARRKGARRWRRLVVEQFEPRIVLADSSGACGLCVINGLGYFADSESTTGNELQITDGTIERRVRDINPGPPNGAGPMAVANGTLFLGANDGTHGFELWKSDGTALGTVLVKDINTTTISGGSSNPSYFENVNGMLFFDATDGTHGQQLWKSDGTEAGTVMVKITNTALQPYWGPRWLTNVNGTLFFTEGRDLWKSDGTDAGTQIVKTFPVTMYGPGLSNLVNLNGTLVFVANDGTHGYELWKSDGTIGGTVVIKDVGPPGMPFWTQQPVTKAGSLLFYTTDDGIHGPTLWASDGTAAGTNWVAPVERDEAVNVNGTLYFNGYDGSHGGELWKSDGTAAGTVLVKDLRPGTSSSAPNHLTNLNGMLVFSADGGTNSAGFWRSDGTPAGTVFFSYISGAPIGVINNVMLYRYIIVIPNPPPSGSVSDQMAYSTVYRTDGTEAGTGTLQRGTPLPFPGNNPPSGTNGKVTISEDTSYVFKVADFGFTDPIDTTPNNFLAVKITTQPISGALMVGSQTIGAGQFVTKADIDNGLLKFIPGMNGNGNAYATFTFQVQDDGGTASGSDLDPVPKTMTVSVVPVNDPPVGISKTVTINEDSSYYVNYTDFGFSDPADTSPVSSYPPNTLVGVYIPAAPTAGMLIVNGTALTTFPTFLPISSFFSGVKFVPTANFNSANAAQFGFTFQLKDDGGTANGGQDTEPVARTLAFNVVPVNDPPLSCIWPATGGASIGTDSMGGRSFYLAAVEDVTYHFSTSDFGFCDPYDAPQDFFVSLIITSLPSSGTLTLFGTPLTNANLPINVSVNSLGVGQLSYTPPPNANGYIWGPGFKLQDSGGTVNGGTDTSVSSSQVEFHIYPVNDAPVGRDNTVTTLEDQSYVFTAGDFGFSDPNDAIPLNLTGPNKFSAVVMTTLPNNGTLTLAGKSVAPLDQIKLSDIDSGGLKFTPPLHGVGSPYASFSFRVKDDGGTATVIGGGNGIGTDIDFTARTMMVNVVGSVNHAPQGSDGLRAIYDDAAYTLKVDDFGFNDPNDSPPDKFLAVVIVSPPPLGTLADGNFVVQPGQIIPALDINKGELIFTPEPGLHFGHDPGPYTSFTFKVQDDGGTDNGGSDTDPIARTLQFWLYDGPSAPVGADSSVTTLEDQSYPFTAADFKFSDPNDFFPNQFQAVKIATLPNQGTLTNDGKTVAPGDFVPINDINVGRLQFAPAADANGPAYARFTFQVQDDGGTANGAQDLDPTPKTMTIDVTSVNDRPSFAAGATQNVTDESGPLAIDPWATQISAGRPDEAGQALQFKVLSNSNAGLFAVQPAIDSTGKLIYTPAGNVSGSADVQIVLKDDGGTANGGSDTSGPQSFKINVTKAHVGHNAVISTDVTGDGHTAPNDALAIINFINTVGPQRVQSNGEAVGLYYDVNADGFIAPSDALAVINQINGFPEGEGEPIQSEDPGAGGQKPTQAVAGTDDLMALLAADVLEAAKRRR